MMVSIGRMVILGWISFISIDYLLAAWPCH